MRHILILTFVFLTFGCSEDDSPPKDLFSVWTETSGGGEFDFTAGDFGMTFPLVLTFAADGGGQCDCTMTLTGDESSGTWSLNSCVYVTGTGTGDPSCNFRNGTGTYFKTTSVLRLEDPFGNFNLYQ